MPQSIEGNLHMRMKQFKFLTKTRGMTAWLIVKRRIHTS